MITTTIHHQCKRLLVLSTQLILLLMSLGSQAVGGGLAELYDFPLCGDLPVTHSNNIIGLSLPLHDNKLAPRLYELSQLDSTLTACVYPLTELMPTTTPLASVGSTVGLTVYFLWLVIAVLVYFLLLPASYRRVFTAMQAASALFLIWSGSTATLTALHYSGLSAQWLDTFAIYQIEDKPRQLFAAGNVRVLDRALLARGFKQLQPDKHQQSAQQQTAIAKPFTLPKTATVKQPLNLRQAAGTNHMRIAVLTSGSQVDILSQSTQVPDWWQVKTAAGLTGWVSSLWLKAL